MRIGGQALDEVEDEPNDANASLSSGELDIPTIQIMIRTGMNMMNLRKLTSESITKLIRTPGIIIQTSTLSSRATKLHLQCRACRSTKVVYPAAGLGGVGGGGSRDNALPRVCDACVSLVYPQVISINSRHTVTSCRTGQHLRAKRKTVPLIRTKSFMINAVS